MYKHCDFDFVFFFIKSYSLRKRNFVRHIKLRTFKKIKIHIFVVCLIYPYFSSSYYRCTEEVRI